MDKKFALPTSSPLTGKPQTAMPGTVEKKGTASDAYKKAMLTALRTNFHKVEDVLQEGIDESGGYLVPDELDGRLVDVLEEENIMRKLGHPLTTSGQWCADLRRCGLRPEVPGRPQTACGHQGHRGTFVR